MNVNDYIAKMKKIISIILICTFALYDLTWAQGGAPLWSDARIAPHAAAIDNRAVNGISIPYDSGSVAQSHSSGSGELVINIQDAHSSLSAQNSIVTMLDSLAANYDLQLIAVEGSEGYVDTSIMRTFPDDGIRRKAAERLMKEGRMSAGEFYVITSNRQVALYGIDDDALYKQNVESFRAVMKDSADRLNALDNLGRDLKRLGDKVYSKPLREFIELSARHREGVLSFGKYWEAVSAIIPPGAIEMSAFGNISKLLAALELEKAVDFNAANDERTALIDGLSKRLGKEDLQALVLKSVDFKNGSISQADFHRYLAELAERQGIDPAPYRNLITFTRYAAAYDRIDIVGLHGEFAGLEKAVLAALVTTDDERKLLDLQEKARILKALFGVSLSNEDAGYLASHRDEFAPERFAAFMKDSRARYGVVSNNGYDLGRIMAGADEALEFYRVAAERDRVMFLNALKRMKEEKQRVAALITGGFHSRGMADLMKANGLSYLVVMPKFKAGEERPYIAVLTKRPGPYRELVKSGEYQLAVGQYFASGDIADLAYVVAIMGAPRQAWVERYKEAYNSMPASRRESRAARAMTPEEFDAFLSRFTPAVMAEIAKITPSELSGARVMEILDARRQAESKTPEAPQPRAGPEGIGQFQALIDPANPHYSKDQFSLPDGPAYNAETGVPLLMSDLKAAGELTPVDVFIPNVGSITLDVDKYIVEMCARYKIDIQKLLQEAVAQSIDEKIRGAKAFEGLDRQHIVVAALGKSGSIIENHKRDHFIGINVALFEQIEKVLPPEKRKAALETFLGVGITHELRHEAGATDEAALTGEDAALTALMAGTRGLHLIDLIETLHPVVVMGKSLYMKALLSQIPEVMPPDEVAAEAEAKRPAGWLESIRRRIWQIGEPVFVHDLADFTASTDTESFNVRRCGDKILIATRQRPAVERRIEGIMADEAKAVPGLSMSYKKEVSRADFTGSRITVVVYCYEVSGQEGRDHERDIREVIRFLKTTARNYRGSATMPGYTTSGIFAQLTYEYNPAMPVTVPDRLKGDELQEAVASSLAKVEAGIKGMGKDERLVIGGFQDLVQKLELFEAGKPFEDLFKLVNQFIDLKRRVIRDLNADIHARKAEFEEFQEALRVKRLSEEEKGELMEKIDRLDASVANLLKNRDNAAIDKRVIERFLYYLLNPAGNFDDDTIRIAAPGKIDGDTPLILFAENLEPTMLDFLIRKYNVQGIVSHGATITSHWVLYAKNNDIPVVIVDMPDKRTFAQEINEQLEAASAKARSEPEMIIHKMVIMRSDITGKGEVVIAPFLPTIEALEDQAVREMAFDLLVDERLRGFHPGQPAKLHNGYEVGLSINADSPESIRRARARHKAGAVGLVRSEYIFANENILEPGKPDVKTNVPLSNYLNALLSRGDLFKDDSRQALKSALKEHFKRLAEAAEGAPVTVRTIDFEPDKRTLIHDRLKERGIDPAALNGLGFYRDSIGREILSVELEAILEAYLDGAANLRILFPMVSSRSDVEGIVHSPYGTALLDIAKSKVAEGAWSRTGADVKAMLDRLSAGIMIETAEAVRNIRDLASCDGVSFCSIGTNDLSRFVLGRNGVPLDRDNPFHKRHLSQLQYEVLKSIADVMEAMRDINTARAEKGLAARELCICGDMASWYDFHVFLVRKIGRLGINNLNLPISLSMSGSRVPAVGVFLSSVTAEDCAGMPTLLAENWDADGLIPAGTITGKIVRDIFNRIYADDGLKIKYGELRRLVEEELEKPADSERPEKLRTIYALADILKHKGRLNTIAAGRKNGNGRVAVPAEESAHKDEPARPITRASIPPIDAGSRGAPHSARLPIQAPEPETRRVELELMNKQGYHQTVHLIFMAPLRMKKDYPQFSGGSVRLFLEAVRRPGDAKETVVEKEIDFLLGVDMLRKLNLIAGSVVRIRIEGPQAGGYLSLLQERAAKMRDKDPETDEPEDHPAIKCTVLVEGAPKPQHAFRILSWWSLLGLGGGADWAFLSVGTWAATLTFLISSSNSLSAPLTGAVIALSAISLAFAATTSMRVLYVYRAIKEANDDLVKEACEEDRQMARLSFWDMLTHDIGSDAFALEKLRKISIYTWYQIWSHELSLYHVTGLAAFLPAIVTRKTVLRLLKRLKGRVMASDLARRRYGIIRRVDMENEQRALTPLGAEKDPRERTREILSILASPGSKRYMRFFGSSASTPYYALCESIMKGGRTTGMRIKYLGFSDGTASSYESEGGRANGDGKPGQSQDIMALFTLIFESAYYQINSDERRILADVPKWNKPLVTVFRRVGRSRRAYCIAEESEMGEYIAFTYKFRQAPEEPLLDMRSQAPFGRENPPLDILRWIDRQSRFKNVQPLGYGLAGREAEIGEALYQNDKTASSCLLPYMDTRNSVEGHSSYYAIAQADLQRGVFHILHLGMDDMSAYPYSPDSAMAKNLFNKLFKDAREKFCGTVVADVPKDNKALFELFSGIASRIGIDEPAREESEASTRFIFTTRDESKDSRRSSWVRSPVSEFGHPYFEKMYEGMFRQFMRIQPNRQGILNRQELARVGNGFEKEPGGAFKRDGRGNTIPVAADAYLALIRSGAFPARIRGRLNQIRDEILGVIPPNVARYRVEESDYNIGISIFQHIVPGINVDKTLTEDERNKLYGIFTEIVKKMGVFRIRLAGVRIKQDGGVIAVWQDDGSVYRIRKELYNNAVRVFGPVKLRSLRLKEAIHTTMVRVLEDIDARTLDELKAKAAKYKDLTGEGLVMEAEGFEITHETQWTVAGCHEKVRYVKLEGNPHAFRALSWWSLLGLGGGLDWAAIFGGVSGALVYFTASNWQQTSFAWGAGAICAAVGLAALGLTSLARVKYCLDAACLAHKDFTLWQALTHDIGHDELALARLEELSPYSYSQVVSHESFRHHVPGLAAFIPGIIKSKSAPGASMLVGIFVPPLINSEKTNGIYRAIRRASRRVPEKVEVVFLADSGDEAANLKALEREGRRRGAAMAIPVSDAVVRDENFAAIMDEFLPQVSRELFTLADPDLAKLDETRAALMDREKLAKMATTLNKVLPAACSERLLESGIYNMRMSAVARQTYGYSADAAEAAAGAVTKDKRLLVMRLGTLGELKIVAEAHRNRMEMAKRRNRQATPMKLKVHLDVSPEDLPKLESGMAQILERMGIDDILGPEDVTLGSKAGPQGIAAILGGLSGASGYKPEQITVVDRVDDKRQGSDIPPGCVFLEYEDEFVTAYHYDAALEAMARPEDPVLFDRFKQWFRIRPIAKFDFDSLRREIERYVQVMMSA